MACVSHPTQGHVLGPQKKTPQGVARKPILSLVHERPVFQWRLREHTAPQ